VTRGRGRLYELLASGAAMRGEELAGGREAAGGHSDGSITEITAENSAAYSQIDGLDDHRGIFAVVAFEGVLNFNYKGNLYLRVVPHLLRYTLLDVDTTLPSTHFTPSKDYNGRPVDDYDD
jgi:hypothetical protein